MIRILVPAETYFQERKIPVFGVWLSYLNKINKNKLVPLVLHPFMSKQVIDEVYDLADGVLFSGGSDFDPKLYGKKKHKKTNIAEPQRDKLEIDLLKRTIRDKKPFFGICRGCQALAIASGGTLVQHIPDIVGHNRHSQPEGQTYDDLADKNKHPVTIDRKSRVYKILKKEKIIVNSGHHQAVATVGKNFRITGKSDDGIVEIIEHNDGDYFCFAAQPHPEAEKDGDLEPLFTAFAKACREFHKS